MARLALLLVGLTIAACGDRPRTLHATHDALDAALRMDTCTPVLAALSTAIEDVITRW